MSDNVFFPAPVPDVAEMNTIALNFFNALTHCKDGDRLKIAVKNQRRAALIEGLHFWVAYVLFQSAGDDVKALSSGFTIGKMPAPAPHSSKPENFRIENGSNPGELIGEVNHEKGVITYLYQYASDAMLELDNWQSVASSKSKCIITNLTPGVKYNCRVAAIGTKNQVMYGDIISRIVA
ncbi:MAG: fibronectin type III domain-containing protein [Ferruginibacter sp.]